MMKKLVYIIGVIAIIGVIGVVIFIYVVPPSQQRRLLENLEIENVSFVNEISKRAFVDMGIVESRETLFGSKWAITLSLTNSHASVNIYKIGVRYHFTRGSEDRFYNVDLRSGRILPSLVRDKIAGHKGEELLQIELISAK